MYRFAVFLFMFCIIYDTIGATLHIGNKSFRLDTQKRTSPSLATIIDNQYFYGVLYPGTAPTPTAYVQYDDKYWIGQNCPAGTYSANGIDPCIQCGIGHYCTGANQRNSCTYGAIACPDATNETDAPSPIDAPINQTMTLDDVNKLIPETDITQWRMLSCCSYYVYADINNPSSLNDVNNACATGTIGPGTYLFIARYTSTSNSIISSEHIAVFDHPVSYASIHGSNIFQHFIDLNHTTYTEYTFSTMPGYWYNNKHAANVQNIQSVVGDHNLCVFELK